MTEPMVLRFSRGGPHRLILRSDPELADVCRTEFTGVEPACDVRGRTIDIEYGMGPRWWLFGGLGNGHRDAAVTLTEKAPWRLEVVGGTGLGKYDLRRVQLDSMRHDGGIGKLDLDLGQPRGTVPVAIHGGLGKANIERPRGVPVRIRIKGGAGRIKLDDQSWAGLGGGTDWSSPGYEEATDRFEITVNGGCGNLTLRED